ncbi:hypothetical protein N5J75_01670 [Pantoea brenneri]|uniref:hypothetical protein n=1 Tax=Pantoea brenneri TaxID=472694 RepID=UPI00244B0D76|nr:hypothetical protein [Pantoea brenneri]MDH2121918.1 hypothetical protein [Pantoea brenneri]
MKLTAERCKRLINQLSFERDNGGMSNQKFDYLDALEIALPILEQEQGEGWIEWGGGECPVDAEVVVSVKYRGDKWAHQEGEAAKFDWRHRGWCADTDIIAYRIIPEQPTNQNGEQ